MAKYISLDSSASGLDSGDLIINAENIMYVEADTATSTKIFLNAGPTGADLITITHTSTGTTPSMRDAINYALTANPGGVKAKVQNPSGISISAVVVS
jgi:hypothetical protein|tara:strand:+ start:2265 stop:2558 length:294 start_codon:yes stop_codon:yes gene_type:complete